MTLSIYPRRAVLAAAALWLTGCASTPPPRYVELTGPEREPYASLSWERWRRVEIAPPRSELDRVSMEVTGKPLNFDPPAMPGWYGPQVFRDTFTDEIIVDYSIGMMGYFEVTFIHGPPPRVARVYFTDVSRSERFTNVLGLHRMVDMKFAERMRGASPSHSSQKAPERKDPTEDGGR